MIIGKLIPAATGLRRYRRLEIEPTEPLARATDEIGLLDDAELAAELGLDRDLDFSSFGNGGADFGDELADSGDAASGGRAAS